MRKILALSVLVLALTGCSQNNAQNCNATQSGKQEVFSLVRAPMPANPSPPKPAPAPAPKPITPPKITPPKVPNKPPVQPNKPAPRVHSNESVTNNPFFWLWWMDEVADVDDIGECENDNA